MKPMLEAKGVKFSEHMSEEDKRTVSGTATRMFSAKNAADAVISFLLDASLVEKARKRKTLKLDATPSLQAKDPGISWEGVTTQLKDAAAAMVKLDPVVTALNETTFTLGRFTKFLETGKVPEDSPLGRTKKSVDAVTGADGSMIPEGDVFERELNDRNNMPDTPANRARILDLKSGIAASQVQPPIFSEKEIKDLQDQQGELDRERGRFTYNGGGRSFTHAPAIPLPTRDPRKVDLPPVQSLEGANVQAVLTGSADVKGEVTVKNKVTASGALISLVEGIKSLSVKLQGQLQANGPGSTGKSSPDAAAPPANTGAKAGPSMDTGMPQP